MPRWARPLSCLIPIALLACIEASRPQTILHGVPEPVPAERWVEGTPALAIVFEGAFVSKAGGELFLDEEQSAYFLRLLRKTGIFADVFAAPAAGAAPPSPHRARLEIRDDYRDTFLPRGIRLDSRMRFAITGPAQDRELVYEAASEVERVYLTVNVAPEARAIVRRECDKHNFLSLVHQMRTDARLFQ